MQVLERDLKDKAQAGMDEGAPQLQYNSGYDSDMDSDVGGGGGGGFGHGHRPMDMRPPHVQMVASEAEYNELVERGDFRNAVRVLVTRLSLARLVYGLEHLNVALAHLSLGRAYFELLAYPRQALDHAQRAKQLHAALKEHRTKHRLHRSQLRHLAASTCCLMGQALTELKRFKEADKTLQRGIGLVSALQEGAPTSAATAQHSAKSSAASTPGPSRKPLRTTTSTTSTAAASSSRLQGLGARGDKVSQDASDASAPPSPHNLDLERVRLQVYLCKCYAAQKKQEQAQDASSELQKLMAKNSIAKLDPKLAIVAFSTIGTCCVCVCV